jgi:hypothetical protein
MHYTRVLYGGFLPFFQDTTVKIAQKIRSKIAVFDKYAKNGKAI